jgi:amino acid permease
MSQEDDKHNQFLDNPLNNLQESEISQLELPPSWIKRTFGPLTKGGVRGNIFLLTVTTLGSSFFYLPYVARQIGLASNIILLLLAASLSFCSSKILIMAFERTRAPTYNDGVRLLIGPVTGFLSNLVILIHTIGQVSSTWIFSYQFLTNGLQRFFEWTDKDAVLVNFKYGFFPLGCLLIFLVTLFGNAEKLKLVSLGSLAMLMYIIVVFIGLTPEYFTFYHEQDQIHPEAFKSSWYILKAWGFCSYMFLNQYAIMPICANLHRFKSRRVTKIVFRSTVISFFVYLAILLCGYFSLPTDSPVEIFLLRPPLPGHPDKLIMYGKIIFGCTLFIAVLVKAHFMLVYFDQIIGIFRDTFLRNTQSLDGEADKPPNIHTTSNAIRTIRRVIFLVSLSTLVFFGINYLSKILGLVGSFVGVFEMIIIPAAVMLVMNKLEAGKKMGVLETRLFVGVCVLMSAFAFSAVVYNLLNN